MYIFMVVSTYLVYMESSYTCSYGTVYCSYIHRYYIYVCVCGCMYVYIMYASLSARVKHLSRLNYHSLPLESLYAKLQTQVTKVLTQVENPKYVSPANTGSNSGT